MSINIFNPFTKIAGPQSLLIGLLAMIITSVPAYLANVHFDGVLDIHFGMLQNIYPVYLTEALISFLSVVLIFYILGLVFSDSRIRFVDVAGTMAFSRIPLLLIPLFALIFPVGNAMQHFLFKYTGMGQDTAVTGFEVISLIFILILMLAVLIWYITLMYHAFRISCNLKNPKSVLLFIIGLIAAEIMSKIILIKGIGLIYMDLK